MLLKTVSGLLQLCQFYSLFFSSFFPPKILVFMAVKIEFVVFWVVTLYSVMNGYQHFGGPSYLHLQGWSAAHSPEIFVSNHHTTWNRKPWIQSYPLFLVSLLHHYIQQVMTHLVHGLIHLLRCLYSKKRKCFIGILGCLNPTNFLSLKIVTIIPCH